MPTSKPKIQGYVEEEIFQAFQQWKAEQGIESISDALTELLKQFFGFEKSVPAAGLGKEEIEALIKEIVETKLDESQEEWVESLDRDLRQMIESKLPTKREIDVKVDDYIEEKFKELNAFRVEFKNEVWLQLKSQFAIWNQTLQEGFSKLDSRLQATEEMLDVKDGVPTLLQEALEFVRLQQYVIEELQQTTLNQLLARIEAVETAIRPIEGLAEISHPLPESTDELPDNLPDNLPEDSQWKIGDRVRVLCPSSYQGRLGTIINFDERLGWHVAVDRWWEAVGVAESAIDERQRRAGNIWCDPNDMELMPQELEEEPPLSSLEQEDLEANPLPIPPQSPLPLEGLKQSELERRLQIAKGTLTKRRNRDDFKEWSRGHDPDKIAWQWDAIARKYLAVE